MKYDFQCINPRCIKGNKPLEFEANMPLADYKKPAECPGCKSTKDVKKIITRAFPKSQTWKP